MLIIPRKERIPEMHFGNNTPKRPHINLPIIPHPQNNLRRSIVPTLYVGVDSLALKTTRPEVDHTNTRLVRLLEQDILWLQIRVDDLALVQEVDRVQYLEDKATDKVKGKTIVTVALHQLVQVHR